MLSSLFRTHADILIHIKLLTGGFGSVYITLVPESTFEAFKIEDKADVLLHRHSYVADSVGC